MILNMIVTTKIFVWLSNRVVAAAAARLVCGSGKDSKLPFLPTHNVDSKANVNAETNLSRVFKKVGSSKGDLRYRPFLRISTPDLRQ